MCKLTAGNLNIKPLKDALSLVIPYPSHERIRWATWVRACNYVKFETGRNFPASTINSNMHCAHWVERSQFVDVAKHVCFKFGSIILFWLRASIKVTCTYSSPPLLCTLASSIAGYISLQPAIMLLYTRPWHYCKQLSGSCVPQCMPMHRQQM